jgi:hypothetical protein
MRAPHGLISFQATSLVSLVAAVQEDYTREMSDSACLLSGRQSFAAAVVIAVLLGCQCGCVAAKYKLAKKNTPPVQLLNIAFPSSPALQPTLATLISYRGPGSWKREALWDEYVVGVENHADRALTVDSATLADAAAMPYAAGADPGALEAKNWRSNTEIVVRLLCVPPGPAC